MARLWDYIPFIETGLFGQGVISAGGAVFIRPSAEGAGAAGRQGTVLVPPPQISASGDVSTDGFINVPQVAAEGYSGSLLACMPPAPQISASGKYYNGLSCSTPGVTLLGVCTVSDGEFYTRANGFFILSGLEIEGHTGGGGAVETQLDVQVSGHIGHHATGRISVVVRCAGGTGSYGNCAVSIAASGLSLRSNGSAKVNIRPRTSGSASTENNGSGTARLPRFKANSFARWEPEGVSLCIAPRPTPRGSASLGKLVTVGCETPSPKIYGLAFGEASAFAEMAIGLFCVSASGGIPSLFEVQTLRHQRWLGHG